ncbi:MAG: GNAT family N-acetyltransferase [Defluviitaleaceae bacterium]|nr:GNAT family N-acetyltransferase [Defluviitaleaceae bacterium]
MDTGCEIVIGEINDIDELEKLYGDLNDYLEINGNYPGWRKGVYPTREDAEKGIKEKELFKLKIGDKIAGAVILSHKQETVYAQAIWGIEAQGNQVIVVRTLVTHPHFMKRGVSKELLKFSQKYALSLGCKAIRLDVSIQNEPAIALYEKFGYTCVGTVDLGLPYEHLKWFKLYELIL